MGEWTSDLEGRVSESPTQFGRSPVIWLVLSVSIVSSKVVASDDG